MISFCCSADPFNNSGNTYYGACSSLYISGTVLCWAGKKPGSTVLKIHPGLSDIHRAFLSLYWINEFEVLSEAHSYTYDVL